MDRALLESYLAQGLSLAAIGRRVELRESTVGYWVAKHGLEAVNRDQHAARGALTRSRLQPLVAAGMSIAEIAETVERSKSTVRHWLREHGLTTQGARRRAASKAGEARPMLRCHRHGLTEFRPRKEGGYRCAKCRAEAVSRRRRKVKRILVEEAGGACQICGYARCIAALEFHHQDPTEKRFGLSYRGVTRSLVEARAEARKCLLLCANCHAEIESGATCAGEEHLARVQCRRGSGRFPERLDPG
jgi:transposase